MKTGKYQKGFWNFAIPAIAGLVGGAMSNRSRENTAEQQMQFNAAEAAANREFQHAEAGLARQYMTEMSNSSYQRAVGDLNKAGLNPMLAYSQGGASSPSSSAPSGSQASYSNIPQYENLATASLSSAFAAQQVSNLERQGENIDADTALKQAQATREHASAGTLSQQSQNLYHQTKKIEAELENIAQDTTNKHTQEVLMKAQTMLAKTAAALDAERISLVEAETEVKKVARMLSEQDLKINKPLEKFSETDMGSANPAIKLLLEILRVGAGAARGHR